MTFNEKIVKLRKLKGITQDELASAVGVSRQAVCKWESGQSYPEVSNLLELKLLFNISIDDLLDDNYEVILPEKKKRRRAAKESAPAAEVNINEEVSSPAMEEIPSETPAEALVGAVSAEEEKTEPEAAEEVYSATEETAKTETVEADEEESKKKVGFFGRIFGRK